MGILKNPTKEFMGCRQFLRLKLLCCHNIERLVQDFPVSTPVTSSGANLYSEVTIPTNDHLVWDENDSQWSFARLWKRTIFQESWWNFWHQFLALNVFDEEKLTCSIIPPHQLGQHRWWWPRQVRDESPCHRKYFTDQSTTKIVSGKALLPLPLRTRQL
jgi:hypothetical protein